MRKLRDISGTIINGFANHNIYIRYIYHDIIAYSIYYKNLYNIYRKDKHYLFSITNGGLWRYEDNYRSYVFYNRKLLDMRLFYYMNYYFMIKFDEDNSIYNISIYYKSNDSLYVILKD
jgi:hypothetical protein